MPFGIEATAAAGIPLIAPRVTSPPSSLSAWSSKRTQRQ